MHFSKFFKVNENIKLYQFEHKESYLQNNNLFSYTAAQNRNITYSRAILRITLERRTTKYIIDTIIPSFLFVILGN